MTKYLNFADICRSRRISKLWKELDITYLNNVHFMPYENDYVPGFPNCNNCSFRHPQNGCTEGWTDGCTEEMLRVF